MQTAINNNSSEPVIPGFELIRHRVNSTVLLNIFKKKKIDLFIKEVFQTESFFDYSKNIDSIFDQPKLAQLKDLYESNLEEFLKEAKNLVSKQIYAFFKAQYYFEQEDYERSLKILNNLIEDKQFHHNVFTLKSHIFTKLENYDRAEINCILSIVSSKGHPDTLYNYGILLIKINDMASAKYALKKTLLLDPSHQLACLYLGAMMRHEIINKLKRFHNKMENKYKMNALAQVRVLNHATRNLWINSYSMREGIKKLIDEVNPKTIIILGAGNCNHFDINQLSEKCEKIKLLDFDKYALGYARRIQRLRDNKKVNFRFDVDVTGVMNDMFFWNQSCPSHDEIEEIIDKANKVSVSWEKGYELALSDGLIQSVLHYLDNKLGSTHPLFGKLFEAIVQKHVELLIDTVCPGGTVMIVLEAMSSEFNETLLQVDSREIKDMIEHFSQYQDQMLSGTNPFYIQKAIEKNDHIHSRCLSIHVAKPWLWFYPGINYLVSALIIKVK